MKYLLIPTDFNLTTLNCIPALVKKFYPQKLEIILVHMVKLTDNMQDLAMLSRRSAERQHIGKEFYEAIELLKRTNPDSINDIRIEFFYGSTIAVFREWLEANHIEDIVVLEDHRYQMLSRNSIDPALMVNRVGKNRIRMMCEPTAKRTEVNSHHGFAEADIS